MGEQEQARPGGAGLAARTGVAQTPTWEVLGPVRETSGESRFPAELCDPGGTQGATESQPVIRTHCRLVQVS